GPFTFRMPSATTLRVSSAKYSISVITFQGRALHPVGGSVPVFESSLYTFWFGLSAGAVRPDRMWNGFCAVRSRWNATRSGDGGGGALGTGFVEAGFVEA